jgi:LmbE family N-acetylglucosaminyl deacetylase
MINLSLAKKGGGPITILCLGAHSDDIEIGCGGSILQLQKTYGNLHIHWVVFSAAGVRGEEARKSAGLFTAGCKSEIVLKEYRDGFFPYNGAAIKSEFEDIKGHVTPDVVFTHWRNDAHQDHRLLSELTFNTFRNHLVLEYEIPKYDGDIGQPSVFIPLPEPVPERKVDCLMEAFDSQRRTKPWFDRATFMGLMRIRGMESNAPSGFAEAFHCRKLVLL